VAPEPKELGQVLTDLHNKPGQLRDTLGDDATPPGLGCSRRQDHDLTLEPGPVHCARDDLDADGHPAEQHPRHPRPVSDTNRHVKCAMNTRIQQKGFALCSKGHEWLSATLLKAPRFLRLVFLVAFCAFFLAICSTQSRADPTEQLLDEAGKLYQNKEYAKAAGKYDEAISRMRQQGSGRSERYALTLAFLGASQAKTGDLAQAEQNLKNAIKLSSKKSFSLLFSELQLALVDEARNRRPDALRLLKDIIAQADRGNSNVAPLMLSEALINLGNILVSANQYMEASKSFSRALKAVQQEGGENDPRLIPILTALGDFEIRRMQLPEAEKWFVRAANLADASGQGETMVYGKIAIALRNIYMATERDVQAVPVLERLIPILDKENGSLSSEALTARCDLAATYLRLKRWDEANGQVRAIIPIARSIAAGSSLDSEKADEFANRFYELARELSAIGLDPEASELLNVSVAIYQGWTGKGWASKNADLVQTLNLLGFSYKALGRVEEAEGIFKSLLKRVDTNSAAAAVLWNNLGQVYREQGHFEDSERAYRQALSIVSSIKEQNPRDRATYLANLGTVLIIRSQLDEAEEKLTQALAVHDQKLGGEILKSPRSSSRLQLS
jgi:tetratricopeptide (TPR) repeat protein